MTIITYKDLEKNREFKIEYDSPFAARKMYNKCKRSKKLRPIAVTSETYEEYLMVVGRLG